MNIDLEFKDIAVITALVVYVITILFVYRDELRVTWRKMYPNGFGKNYFDK